MGYGAVGVVMLAIVFIFYMRMIDARTKARKTKSQTDSILEKADVLESVAQDKAALKVINDGLKNYPNDSKLLNRKQRLIDQIDESAAE